MSDPHVVIMIADGSPRSATEHVYDCVQRRILRLSAYRLHVFIAKDQYLRSLVRYGNQAIPGQLKNMFANVCLRSLNFIWRPGNFELQRFLGKTLTVFKTPMTTVNEKT